MTDQLSCRFGVRLALAIGLVFTGFASNTFASVLPEPVFSSAFADAPNDVDLLPRNSIDQNCAENSDCEVSRIIVSGDKFTQAMAFVSGISPAGVPPAGAVATVQYFFAVLGTHTGPVPIVITANILTTATGSPTGFAEGGGTLLVVSDSTNETKFKAFGSGVNFPPFTGLDASGTAQLLIDVIPDSSKESFARLSVAGSASNGAFSALADPTISFAPGFDSTGLTLEVSQLSGPSVPEPSTWVMMLVGFGALGLMMRVRRKRPITLKAA